MPKIAKKAPKTPKKIPAHSAKVNERELKSLVSTILDTIVDGVITINELGIIQSYNKACGALFGYAPEEVIGKNVNILMPNPYHREHDQYLKNYRTSGVAKIIGIGREVSGRHKDGSTFPMELAVGATTQGGDHAFVGIIRDISARITSENEQKLLASIVQYSEDAIISRTNDGTINSWNKGAVQVFGYSAKEAIGKPYDFIIPPECREEERQRLAQLKKGEHLEPVETVRMAKDGRRIPVLLSVSPIYNTHNEIIGSARIIRDMTSLKKAEAAAKLLASIVESSEDAILSKTLDGIITSWNAGAEHLFGYSARDIIGKSINTIIPADRREEENSIAAKFNEGKPVEHFETVRVAQDGREIYVSLTASPIRDEAGNMVGMSKIIRDITERHEGEKAREQLRHAQKMESLGQLTGGIAHDFNNLLAVVMGNLDFMMERTDENHPLREFIRPSVNAAEHGAELTKQLLAFGRKQTLQPKVISINELLHYFSSLVRHTLGEHIKVIVALAPEAWNIHADPNQLQNALLNMAVNARDAMPGGGKLIFETKNATVDKEYAKQNDGIAPGDYVVISISDTGQGMSKEVLEKAFEPFFTTKEVGKGSGLGLSMVYGFVKQSKGHVKIYSEIGHGTTFKIFLPRSKDVLYVPRQEKHKKLSTGRKNKLILVVEDNKEVLKLTSSMVESLGYTVLQAEEGEAAIKVLKAHPDIDLLLTDVMLPGAINGPVLAKRAVALYPKIKVLFNSGYAEHAIMQNGLLEEGVNLISKPFRKQQLANKIEEVLKQP